MCVKMLYFFLVILAVFQIVSDDCLYGSYTNPTNYQKKGNKKMCKNICKIAPSSGVVCLRLQCVLRSITGRSFFCANSDLPRCCVVAFCGGWQKSCCNSSAVER